MRTMRCTRDVIGIDINPSGWTDRVGSIVDRDFVREALRGVATVLHTATLHKPHVATHTRQQFVDVNVTGTLNLLEEAVAAGVRRFVFTSTTSVYGLAMSPPAGAPAVWVDEDLVPIPKNIYGITKLTAENLCALFQRKFGLACIVLRTSRFFPEPDDDAATRAAYAPANVNANELLYRRLDIADAVSAHLCAAERAEAIGFGRYVISATTPFRRADVARLRTQAAQVVAEYVPQYVDAYARRGWTMFADIERVYDNARARAELGWRPQHDFAAALESLQQQDDFRSPLARAIGSKAYHPGTFTDGPYPVE